MKRISCKISRLLSAVLCLTLSLTACATTGADNGRSATARPLWQSREQFITIVPRESKPGQTLSGNDHPLRISPAGLNRLLSRPAVLTAEDDKKQPLFTTTELNLLAEHVSAGLSRCGTDEEIVFAIFGYHTSLLGLAREELVTTGRIFSSDGKLNLVLGMVHQRVKSNEDRRLAPFTPGSRFSPATLDITIIPATTTSAYSLKRPDWITFTMGEEPPAETTPAEVTTTQPVGKSIEERLLRLKSLRDKDLINDEEYRGKRLQILNEL